jgi:arylsulfatase
MLIRWPAQIKPGSVSNGIQSHYDLFTTLASAAGVPNIASVLKNSHNVRIDGVDNIEHWRGNQASARNSFIYYNERELVGVRIGPWKGMLKERNGFFDPLKQSFAFFNLRMDPYEQRGGNESNKLALRKAWIGGQIQDLLTEHIMSLRETPPRQIGGSLRPDDATRQPPPKAP